MKILMPVLNEYLDLFLRDISDQTKPVVYQLQATSSTMCC